MPRSVSRRRARVPSPPLYRRRSAVFALLYAVGFLLGWAISFLIARRYEAAFALIGAHRGQSGVLICGVIALAVCVAAMALRVWGGSYFRGSTVSHEDAQTDALIVAGPFRFVRHPLYLGNLLLAVGLGAAAPLAGWIFIIVGNVVFVRWLAAYEDSLLAARHPEEFAQYRRHVPALLPRLLPVPARKGTKPSLMRGLMTESFTLFLIAGVAAVFAIPRFGALVLLGCYVAAVVVQRRIEHASEE